MKIRDLVLVSLVAMIAAGCGKKVFKVPTNAMEPTIPAGTLIEADMRAYRSSKPERWDVVIFEPLSSDGSRQLWAMRVVGLPGDVVQFNEQGLMINGKSVQLPAAIANLQFVEHVGSGRKATVALPFTVSADSCFVLGDNASNSNDSRFWGELPMDRIRGKVLVP